MVVVDLDRPCLESLKAKVVALPGLCYDLLGLTGCLAFQNTAGLHLHMLRSSRELHGECPLMNSSERNKTNTQKLEEAADSSLDGAPEATTAQPL